LVNVVVITACSGLPLATRKELAKAPDEREILFERAEQLQKAGDHKSAESLYYRITREPGGPSDPIYDKSLWNLAGYYEQADLPEKALLALDELSKRRSSTISLTRIRIAQIKNHYRVTNYYQAQGVRNEIDRDYKSQLIAPGELYEALYYTTTLYYDRHIADELTFLGEVQKYFFYIMESELAPENEKLTELLIFYYDGFLTALEKKHLPVELKRQLVISLLDQLRKFDRYKIAGEKRNPMTIGRFSEYSDARQKKLTEWLTDDK
jgi:hypothetical protein